MNAQNGTQGVSDDDLDWRQRAACRDHDPDLWFPNPSDAATRAAALRICRDCPVVQQCGAHAVTKPEPWGIWGAQTQKARNTTVGIKAHHTTERHHLKPHGTPAAARRHWRDGEKPCEECRVASNRDHAERVAARQGRR